MNIQNALMAIDMFWRSHAFFRISKSSIAQAYKWRSKTLKYIGINLILQNWEKINIIVN